jgi:hypothetical protein
MSFQSMITDRSPKEIRERIYEVLRGMPMGLCPEAMQLLKFLEYNDAKEFFVKPMSEEDWLLVTQNLTTPNNLIRRNYRTMWQTANEHLAVESKSNHDSLRAWLWLDLKDGVLEMKESVSAQAHGKPLLYKTSLAYGLDWRKRDNNSWVVNDRVLMADEAIKELFGNKELTVEE